ncbi:hypothetical protein L484_022267 [Morus notabilis]|uniref:Letm1 RBD domain-containing protein n=1 Tax=Morus notabilis TaxID=981085 RepID=W9SGN8_9ROSA|nr:hypothetical protein L484_022267 [Morus notabilis]
MAKRSAREKFDEISCCRGKSENWSWKNHMGPEEWVWKLCYWKDEFKSTMQHYWLGTKLLCVHVRISSRLLLKLVSGKSLSRREMQQLKCTIVDIFKLGFALGRLIPLGHGVIPYKLSLMTIPRDEELKRKLHARIKYAEFLQDTVIEMATEIQTSRSGEVRKTAKDLDEFMNKVRNGEHVSNDDILGFAKLFSDELTLDNISRPPLRFTYARRKRMGKIGEKEGGNKLTTTENNEGAVELASDSAESAEVIRGAELAEMDTVIGGCSVGKA